MPERTPRSHLRRPAPCQPSLFPWQLPPVPAARPVNPRRRIVAQHGRVALTTMSVTRKQARLQESHSRHLAPGLRWRRRAPPWTWMNSLNWMLTPRGHLPDILSQLLWPLFYMLTCSLQEQQCLSFRAVNDQGV